MNPGRGLLIGFDESHIVSPTFVSDRDFIPVIIKPISPEFNSLTSTGFGVKTPTFSIMYSLCYLKEVLFSYFFDFSINYSYENYYA